MGTAAAAASIPGAFGIGLGINYTAGADRMEIINVFRLAAERKTPCLRAHALHGAIDAAERRGLAPGSGSRMRRSPRSVHGVTFTRMALAQTPSARHDRRRTKERPSRQTESTRTSRLGLTSRPESCRRLAGSVGISYNGCLARDPDGEALTAETFSGVTRKVGETLSLRQFPKRPTRQRRGINCEDRKRRRIENGERPSPQLPARMRDSRQVRPRGKMLSRTKPFAKSLYARRAAKSPEQGGSR